MVQYSLDTRSVWDRTTSVGHWTLSHNHTDMTVDNKDDHDDDDNNSNNNNSYFHDDEDDHRNCFYYFHYYRRHHHIYRFHLHHHTKLYYYYYYYRYLLFIYRFIYCCTYIWRHNYTSSLFSEEGRKCSI